MRKRKLALHRETIARLDPERLRTAAGGSVGLLDCSMAYCPTETCNVSCGNTCTAMPNCNDSHKCNSGPV